MGGRGDDDEFVDEVGVREGGSIYQWVTEFDRGGRICRRQVGGGGAPSSPAACSSRTTPAGLNGSATGTQ